MVKVYRQLFADRGIRDGVLLDSPFGFQENVPQLTAKIVEYFADSLHVDMTPASLLRVEDASDLARASFLESVRSAQYVFAGPGSPSYAMRQWGPVNLADAVHDVLGAGGLVTFASAAALTLGAKTAPIYELYKVGHDPFWLDGLDVLSAFGLRCAVIPHFDNAEGGNHDTRFCYLGERRLRALESMLDDDVAVLGVDEYTAVVFDWDADTLTVHGRGAAYWRRGGSSRTLEKETTIAIDELRNAEVTPRPATGSSPCAPTDLDAVAERAAAGGDDSLAAIAQLLKRAHEGGEGRIDPAPIVEGVLSARQHARDARQFALADELRDALVAAGIEVQDSPDGVSWSLREP